MFVTQELRERTSVYLVQLEECANWLIQACEENVEWSDKPAYRWAAERTLHVAIECSTDAANDVIDALVMRDPGGYADILRVLMEEGVVSREWFSQFEGALAYREKLVHSYLSLTPVEAYAAAKAYGPLLMQYSTALKDYLGIA